MKIAAAVLIFGFSLCASSIFAINPVELPQMNGDLGVYQMQNHPDGIFVVEAYFLGCPYCNDNAPKVNDMAERFSNDSRVQVLDVGIDRDNASYDTWIKRHNPNHPVLKDGSRKLISQLGTSGFPSTYVVNCKGQLVESTEGSWGQEEEQRITAAIEKLQAEGCHRDSLP